MWQVIMGLIKEIKTCESSGSHMGAMALCYVCIDTMAFLAMAADKAAQTKSDFVSWVDTYLKGHPDQPYAYRGADVYAARCAVLHAYGSEANVHRQDPNVKLFGYHDGGKHMYDPAVNDRLVLIGTASFINDVVIGVETFMRACVGDAALRARVENRLPAILMNTPLRH